MGSVNLIVDTVYLKYFKHYGYNYQNKSVYVACFTDDINKALSVKLERAEDIVYCLNNLEYIVVGNINPDIKRLIIK